MPIAVTALPFSQGSSILPIHKVISLPTHLKPLNMRTVTEGKKFLSLSPTHLQDHLSNLNKHRGVGLTRFIP